MRIRSDDSILVTGGTGFIGSHLVRRLMATGAMLHLLVRPGSSRWRIKELSSNVVVWPGDLTEPASLRNCILGCRPSRIFHLAGLTGGRRWSGKISDVESSVDVNLKGTLRLLSLLQDTGAPVQSVVRTGSLFEYGFAPVPYREGQREMPATPYSSSHLGTLAFIEGLVRSGLRLPVLTLRLGWVYGPMGPSDFFIASLIQHCIQRRNFDMGSGTVGRDFIYVDDVVDAFIKASKAELLGSEVINIASGRCTNLREVAELIIKKTESGILLNVGALPDNTGAIQNAYCEIDKAKRLLNWRPTTTLEAGLERTISWYYQNARRSNPS